MSLDVYPTRSLIISRQNPNALIVLTNNGPTSVSFKVKTTAPKVYFCRPNKGIVDPNQQVSVNVSILSWPSAELEWGESSRDRDKFLVEGISHLSGEEYAGFDVLFAKDPTRVVQSSKLRVSIPEDVPTPEAKKPLLSRLFKRASNKFNSGPQYALLDGRDDDLNQALASAKRHSDSNHRDHFSQLDQNQDGLPRPQTVSSPSLPGTTGTTIQTNNASGSLPSEPDIYSQLKERATLRRLALSQSFLNEEVALVNTQTPSPLLNQPNATIDDTLDVLSRDNEPRTSAVESPYVRLRYRFPDSSRSLTSTLRRRPQLVLLASGSISMGLFLLSRYTRLFSVILAFFLQGVPLWQVLIAMSVLHLALRSSRTIS